MFAPFSAAILFPSTFQVEKCTQDEVAELVGSLEENEELSEEVQSFVAEARDSRSSCHRLVALRTRFINVCPYYALMPLPTHPRLDQTRARENGAMAPKRKLTIYSERTFWRLGFDFN